MTITLIHSGDLQIGRSFAGMPSDVAHALREARLAAIDTLATLAGKRGASHILIAGDVFDGELLAPATLRQPLARMRGYPALTWHLLPGNHDPHRAGGVWERLVADGLPSNVRPWLSAVPAEIEPGVWLLPAPLTARATSRDPTASMDDSTTPLGAIRLGLAHGSIRGFGGDGEAAVLIAPDRARRAGLTYLALGDWHGALRISERCWYAGTPEPDRYTDNGAGHALVVRLAGAQRLPEVEKVATATFQWREHNAAFTSTADVEAFEAGLRDSGPPLDRQLIRLRLTGHLGLGARTDIAVALERMASAVRHLQLDWSGVTTLAVDEDLEYFARHGALAPIARQLQAKAADAEDPEAAVAADALSHLYAVAVHLERSQ